MDPPNFWSLGLWVATEEQGHSSQVLGGSSEDRWCCRGFLVDEDAPVDVASTGLRGPASSSSEGRPLLVDTELEFVQLAYPVLDMSGTRRRWRRATWMGSWWRRALIPLLDVVFLIVAGVLGMFLGGV